MRDRQRVLLKELRSVLVGKLHTQPFTIYTDATIEDLLKAQPKSIKELTQVKGFPEKGKRIKGFGEAVVRIFTDTNSIKTFEIEGTGKSLAIGVQLKHMEVF